MQGSDWKKLWQNIRKELPGYDGGIKVAAKSFTSLYKMKVKNIFTAAIILIAATAIFGCSSTRKIKAEPPLDSTAVRNMIDSQSFVFIPRYVSPTGFRRRDLTPGFDVSVSKDSLISYLPFWGRGYIAPMSPSDVDFDFTSTKFTYAVKPDRRGWIVTIRPADQTYLRELFFRIFDNSSASLTVSSIDRSFISYDGYITRRAPAPKK